MKVYLLLTLVALGLVAVATPIVRWTALHFNIVPELRGRDIQSVPIPRIGGIAMVFGLVGTLLIASRIPYTVPVFSTSAVWSLMWGAVAMCVLGVIDDIVELDWFTKLAGQILTVGFVALNGVQLVSFPIFGLTIGSSRLSLFSTVFVVVAIINAVNFIDGLDGLAAGVVAIGAGAFFVYSYFLSRITHAASYATGASLIVAGIVGICVGFLWYNFHPSSIMMGGGAETLGLVLAGASIIVTGQIDPAVLGTQQVLAGLMPIILPIAVIIVPVGDLFVTALKRLLRGKSPFHADRSHFHDDLLQRGHSHRGVVIILYIWTTLISFSVVALLKFTWIQVAVAVLPVIIATTVLTSWEFPARLPLRFKRRTCRTDSGPELSKSQPTTAGTSHERANKDA